MGAKKLLTPEQLSDYLQISVSWIHKRTMSPAARKRAGVREEIPCVRIGGAVRFDPVAVEKWLRDQAPRKKSNGRIDQ